MNVPNFNESLIVATKALVKAGIPPQSANAKAASTIFALYDAGFLVPPPSESTAGKDAGPAC